jgi:hypothetical protein
MAAIIKHPEINLKTRLGSDSELKLRLVAISRRLGTTIHAKTQTPKPGCIDTIERYIVVGGTGLGMSTTNKFVCGFVSSDPNSDKKVSTTSDFAVARIFEIGFLVL